MVQRLGDGSRICDKCWAIEYPGKAEPENNWTLGRCDFCGSHVHTSPRPWTVWDPEGRGGDPICICALHGQTIAVVEAADITDEAAHETQIANATFIVRAVNTHDALVQALRDCVNRLDQAHGGDPNYPRCNATIAAARDALAQAQEAKT